MKFRAVLLVIGAPIFILAIYEIFVAHCLHPKNLGPALAAEASITSRGTSATSELTELSEEQGAGPVSPFAIKIGRAHV